MAKKSHSNECLEIWDEAKLSWKVAYGSIFLPKKNDGGVSNQIFWLFLWHQIRRHWSFCGIGRHIRRNGFYPFQKFEISEFWQHYCNGKNMYMYKFLIQSDILIDIITFKKSSKALIVRCKGCIWEFLWLVYTRKDGQTT